MWGDLLLGGFLRASFEESERFREAGDRESLERIVSDEEL